MKKNLLKVAFYIFAYLYSKDYWLSIWVINKYYFKLLRVDPNLAMASPYVIKHTNDGMFSQLVYRAPVEALNSSYVCACMCKQQLVNIIHDHTEYALKIQHVALDQRLDHSDILKLIRGLSPECVLGLQYVVSRFSDKALVTFVDMCTWPEVVLSLPYVVNRLSDEKIMALYQQSDVDKIKYEHLLTRLYQMATKGTQQYKKDGWL